MQPYQQILDDLNLLNLTDEQNIPQLNGCLLCVPAGTVWLVVNGQARGFTSFTKLLKICNNYPMGFGPPADIHQNVIDRAFGTPPPPYPDFAHRDIKAFFTYVPHIDFIDEGLSWSDSLSLVYFDGGPIAIYDMEDKQTLYGIPSPAIAYQHKLNVSNRRQISQQEYEYIGTHGNNRLLNGFPDELQPPTLPALVEAKWY